MNSNWYNSKNKDARYIASLFYSRINNPLFLVCNYIITATPLEWINHSKPWTFQRFFFKCRGCLCTMYNIIAGSQTDKPMSGSHRVGKEAK